MEILTIKNLNFTYPEADSPALQNINLSLQEGDFAVLCGKSGCGKSTLLRQLKPQIAPFGEKNGSIFFEGKPLEALSDRETASLIGFVSQSPENQIVTDKVWHELAFGAENLGLDSSAIRRRVAETASFFGIEDLFHRNTATLSGGQKQLLCLASAMVLRPKLLILDEPTAMLDPIAADNFLQNLYKLNRELGCTILLADHRLEELLPMANHTVVMEDGKILCMGSPREVGAFLKENQNDNFLAMPTAMRVWGALPNTSICPVSPTEGRNFLFSYQEKYSPKPISFPEYPKREEKCISAKEIWFRYEKDSPDILKNFNLDLYRGELLCLMGGNGGGKTTALRVLSGSLSAYRGDLNCSGKIARLPQTPQNLFLKKTVKEDLFDILKNKKLPQKAAEEKLKEVLSLCRLTHLLDRHPYDLSGGETQRAALAKLLLTDPDILLLDEPTKGMDASFKREFAVILKSLQKKKVGILMVSHDVEFCAHYADRVALIFDGNIVCDESPISFFSGNRFYTTVAAHIADGLVPNAITAEHIISAFGGEVEEEFSIPDEEHWKSPELSLKKESKKLPFWRKLGATLSGISAVLVMLYASKNENLTEMLSTDGITPMGIHQFLIYAIFLFCLILTAAFLFRKSSVRKKTIPKKEKVRLSKRTILSVFLILLAVPMTLFLGLKYFGQKQYNLTAIAVLLEISLPFFLVFEGKKPKARELVVIAVLCGLSVAGRAAFFMLPQFKPVMAMAILAGIAFGGETGFLVGALSMFLSNFLFSQGPWTPWQMFAMGFVGFLAGIIYHSGRLSRGKISLSVFGAVSAILIYGGIMNFSSALIWASEALNLKILLGYYITGFPMDIIHAIATAIFLYALSEPILEKLERVKVKYGMISV